MQTLIDNDGCVVAYFPGWLQEREIDPDDLYDTVSQCEHFTRPEIKMFQYTGPTPRDQIALGDAGMTAHRYTGTSVPMHSWDAIDERIERIRDLISESEELMELSRQSIPNSCLINYYRNGTDYVGYHADKELRDTTQTVYTVTLGTPRRFILQNNATKDKIEITPDKGDLLIMTGNTQKLWKHTVPKITLKKCSTGRISLTYRVL